MAEKVLELGEGLEIWRFDLDETMEQDVNARTMSKEAFDRLTTTISKDKRLESLPFLAKTERGLEIVSGHHRTRAMRTAGVTTFYGIVDVTGLSRDEIKAKQLAHNAIQGYDDPQLIAQIYESIGDVDARLESFIDPKAINIAFPKISIDDIDLGLKFETVIVMFIPWEKEYVKETLRAIEREISGTKAKETWLAELSWWDSFSKLGRQITREYDIRTMSTVLFKMAELARKQLGEEAGPEAEAKSIRDIAGTFWIPTDAAEVIEGGIAAMIEDGNITDAALWRAFELWAADYLAGRNEATPERTAT